MKNFTMAAVLLTSTVASGTPANQVEVTTLDSTVTMVMRVTTTADRESEVVQAGFPQIMARINELDGEITGAPFTRYHKYQPDSIDIEFGFPVKNALISNKNIFAGSLPATKAATLLHVGPYQTVTNSYEMIMRWIRDSGAEQSVAPWEVYLNDPRTTTPDKYETLIIFPIR